PGCREHEHPVVAALLPPPRLVADVQAAAEQRREVIGLQGQLTVANVLVVVPDLLPQCDTRAILYVHLAVQLHPSLVPAVGPARIDRDLPLLLLDLLLEAGAEVVAVPALAFVGCAVVAIQLDVAVVEDAV